MVLVQPRGVHQAVVVREIMELHIEVSLRSTPKAEVRQIIVFQIEVLNLLYLVNGGGGVEYTFAI